MYHGIDWLADRIYSTRSATKVQSLARTYMSHTTDEWEDHDKYTFMREIQVAALRDIPLFRETLVTSGMRPLREATDHHSWGFLRVGLTNLVKSMRSSGMSMLPRKTFNHD